MLQQAIDQLTGQIAIRSRYDNYIGGKWVAPVQGLHFDNPPPVTGATVCSIARSTAADIELVLDAALMAREAWGRTSASERAIILNKTADKMEEKLNLPALVEIIDNGKASSFFRRWSPFVPVSTLLE